MKFDTEKYGLVFAGGGGKGGYEIGVWKALNESKTLSVGAVSGTSVGALNAALYAAGDYDKAEDIWRDISNGKILSLDKFSYEKIFYELIAILNDATGGLNTNVTYNGTARSLVTGIIGGVAKVGIGAGGFVWSAAGYAIIRSFIRSRGGLFSREGLEAIIKESGILDNFNEDSIPCYATCYSINDLKPEPFLLNEHAADKMISILLASSAIPVAFPIEYIDGKRYVDGGVPGGNNIPVDPLYEKGFRKFIVVHLTRDGVDSFTNKYDGATFIHVFPKLDQGGFWKGTLDFDPAHAAKRIEQGYNDMKEQIQLLNDIDKLLSERNDSAEEIHINSGKYYGSLSAVLKNSVVSQDEYDVMEDADFEFSDYHKELDAMMNGLKGNAREINRFVLESVTHISDMEAQMDEVRNTKGFKKVWNTISGKKARLKEGIDRNLISAQEATIETLKKLVEADEVSVELLKTVQSQLQGATLRMGKVLEEHGHNISTIKNDYAKIIELYGELCNGDQKLAEEIKKVYKLFFEEAEVNKANFKGIGDEIAALKGVQRLQNWRINIKYQTYGGKDYQDLDIYEKIVCIASDFFFLTKGKWDDEIILFVKGALDSLGISSKELISYNGLIYKLMNDDRINSYLFERNGVRIYSINSETDAIPHFEAIVDGICIGKRASFDESTDIKSWISNFMLDRTGGADLLENTAFDIVCELLVILMYFSKSTQSEELLPAYRDIKKAALVGDVEAECKYAGLLLEHNYIEEAYNMVLDMENRGVVVPSFDSLRDKVLDKYVASY